MMTSQFTLIVALLIGMVGLAQTARAQQTFTVSPSGDGLQATFLLRCML